MARSTVLLIVIGALLTVVIAAAAAVAAIRGAEDELPEGTPGRTVQLYLRAIEDRDATRAYSYLSPELASRCSTFPKDAITYRGSASIRATLEEARIAGGTATVRVELTENFSDAPFGQSDPRQRLVFELQQIEGEWWFSESPWPLYCPPKFP